MTISVICTDKTGTITEGKLAFREGTPVCGVPHDWLMKVAALACRQGSSDPLDVAILSAAPPISGAWERLAVYPFTEGRRRETATWRRDAGAIVVAVKGAPETILELCDLNAPDLKHWQQVASTISSRGEKVIACAWQEVGAAPTDEPMAAAAAASHHRSVRHVRRLFRRVRRASSCSSNGAPSSSQAQGGGAASG